MQAIIKPHCDEHLLVSIARRAGEAEQQAQQLTQGLFQRLRRELADWAILSFPSRQSSRMQILCSPSVKTTIPAVRAQQLSRLESVVAEELAEVDAMRALSWVMANDCGKLIQQLPLYFGRSAERAQLATSDARYSAIKMPLIEAYLGGKSPVRQSDLFEEFHHLPAHLRRLLGELQRSPELNCDRLMDTFGMIWHSAHVPAAIAGWPVLAAKLIEAGWAVRASGSTAGKPLLKRGAKSDLLPHSQMFL